MQQPRQGRARRSCDAFPAHVWFPFQLPSFPYSGGWLDRQLSETVISQHGDSPCTWGKTGIGRGSFLRENHKVQLYGLDYGYKNCPRFMSRKPGYFLKSKASFNHGLLESIFNSYNYLYKNISKTKYTVIAFGIKIFIQPESH